METKFRVRFAPSPTGYLHLGSVRSAMFNFLFARHHKGAYLLRIEDTDHERSKKEYLNSIIHSLKWLGLFPDEEVVIQSSRIEEHKKAAHALMQAGKAYPCFCEAEDAQKKIEELDSGFGSKYSGVCRDKKFSDEDLKKPHAIRFKLPHHEGNVTFHDLIRGDISIAYDQLDDFVIVRRDGSPTYNFVVVLDDIFMNITHIIRGEDHISNTPKQFLIYQAFDKAPPAFAHIPLILGPAGNRLSKRDAAVSVEEYRAMGFMAEALFNYLVRLGWSHGDQEIFTKEEMISFFSLEHVGKKGSIFDVKKLEWLNGVYMRQSSPLRILEAIKEMSNEDAIHLTKLWDRNQLESLIIQYKERTTTLSTLVHDISALAQDPETLDLSLLKKWHKPHTKKMVGEFIEEIETLSFLDHDLLLNAAQTIITSNNAKLVELAQAARLAITGSVQSPSIFDLIAILGKEKSISRLKKLHSIL